MKFFLKTKDYALSGKEFDLLYNDSFDMLVTNPLPDDLDGFYESDSYISHTDSRASLVDRIYQIVKGFSIKRKVSLISKNTLGPKKVLDVGAGTGDFLVRAKSKGWEVDGVEPNAKARSRALEKGVSLYTRLESLAANKYNCITLWHVLEHLPDLENQILKLVWHLEEKGTLIIAVPNYKSFDARHYKEYWAAYDVPRHLWHFSKSSIDLLFKNHNVKLVETRPMIFDAYYVSLLSEKYKSGKSSFLHYPKAIIIGLWSNLSAWKTKEHSSLIYVLKKQ